MRTDLDAIKLKEPVGSLQTYEYILAQSKRNKFLSLKTIRDTNCNTIDNEKLKDEELACFARKFKKSLRIVRPYEKYYDDSSTSRKYK